MDQFEFKGLLCTGNAGALAALSAKRNEGLPGHRRRARALAVPVISRSTEPEISSDPLTNEGVKDGDSRAN